MATTEQIPTTGEDPIASITERFVGDDWAFPFEFADDDDVALDVSSYTYTAKLITESPTYTATDMTGSDGAVSSTDAAVGLITVTVYDVLTSTLTADQDSVDDTSVSPVNTRLALLQTSGVVTTTVAIIPIRVIRR